MIELVIGGARSGKSGYAEKRAAARQGQVTYIATATGNDDEMKQRIEHHRRSRPAHWLLIEEPLNLGECLRQPQLQNTVVLIDCMTLWLSNWLCQYSDDDFLMQRHDFITALGEFQGDCIIVSNEVGSGIIPMGELSRRFVDQAGWLNQALASVSERTALVVAGLPLVLKDQGKATYQ